MVIDFQEYKFFAFLATYNSEIAGKISVHSLCSHYAGLGLGGVIPPPFFRKSGHCPKRDVTGLSFRVGSGSNALFILASQAGYYDLILVLLLMKHR